MGGALGKKNPLWALVPVRLHGSGKSSHLSAALRRGHCRVVNGRSGVCGGGVVGWCGASRVGGQSRLKHPAKLALLPPPPPPVPESRQGRHKPPARFKRAKAPPRTERAFSRCCTSSTLSWTSSSARTSPPPPGRPRTWCCRPCRRAAPSQPPRPPQPARIQERLHPPMRLRPNRLLPELPPGLHDDLGVKNSCPADDPQVFRVDGAEPDELRDFFFVC